MAWTRAGLVLLVAVAVALVFVSGGSPADPRTPAGLAGLPPPFLGTAVTGGGGLTAAVDAYGDVVDLRAPGPAGSALIDNPAARQATGTVSATTGIVARMQVGDGPARPLWEADSVTQRYRPATNVVRTRALWGPASVTVTAAAVGSTLALVAIAQAPVGVKAQPLFETHLGPGVHCASRERRGRAALVCSLGSRSTAGAERLVAEAAADERRWVDVSHRLGTGAPHWARGLYRRSLLVLRALTDRSTGAVAAGARDGWAYVWPRDAGATALALAVAGYRTEARRVAGFLQRLDLGAAARFYGDGTPVPGRAAQGDAAGGVAAAVAASVRKGGADSLLGARQPPSWRARADYQEGDPGDYLGNALASSAEAAGFGTPGGLVRRASDPGSGLDSAAAWAVGPFPQPALFPAARRTMNSLAAAQSRFGITPSAAWDGDDPWTAPTAWTAWSLAALGERRRALRLLVDLRRAATPAGVLPERVDVETGLPRSTTPLTWSHAFAILALSELWPPEGR